MNEPHSILVVEDDETDVWLLRRAFTEAGIDVPLQIASDGQAAIDFFEERCAKPGTDDRLPALLILDLKMPRRTGFEVLQWLRAQPVLRCLPVMIFSSSAHQQDVERAFEAGANAFVVKPASTVERAEFGRFVKQWLHFNQLPLAASEGLRVAREQRLDLRPPATEFPP
jgi:CheY-like chemotaxis protein